LTPKLNPLLYFALFLLGTILINLSWCLGYLGYALKNDFASHGVLIPVISLFLLWQDRQPIFYDSRQSAQPKPIVWAIGSVVLLAAGWTVLSGGILQSLTLETLALAVIWIAGFYLFFGPEIFLKSLFPLFFLLLMIPLPEKALDVVVRFLQMGSAEMANMLFRITGTEFFRMERVFFKFPSTDLVIEVAPQCSGIRSSTALFITTLLAGHLTLRSGWRKLALVLISIPVALFKNAVRIVALTLLAIYIDPHYITGHDLHRRGGVVFFILALLIMLPILWALRKSEQKSGNATNDVPTDEKQS